MGEPSPAPAGPNDAQLGGVTEKELDDLLLQASELAADASHEVGVPATKPGASPLPGPEELSSTLDDELGRLDGLIASAATEVGAEPLGTSAVSTVTPTSAESSSAPAKQNDPNAPPAPAGTPSKTPASGGPAAARHVPDFMLEFTEPASDPPATPSPAVEKTSAPAPSGAARNAAAETASAAAGAAAGKAQRPSELAASNDAATATRAGTAATATPPSSASRAATAKPGLVGTGMLGVIGTTASQQPQKASASATDASFDSASTESETEEAAHPRRLADVLSPVIDLLERLLELLDRPFAKVGAGVKEIIGWVALATLGTAVVMYLIRVI